MLTIVKKSDAGPIHRAAGQATFLRKED